MMYILKQHVKWVLVLPLLLVLGVLIFNNAGAKPLGVETKEGLVFSGTLEARQTRIAAEISARVTRVNAGKGDNVKLGDVLVETDDGAVQSSIHEAESAVKSAQANLDQTREQARPGAVAVAESGVTQAQADLNAAQSGLNDANRALSSPQELTAQMHAWEAKVQTSSSEVEQAQAAIAGIKDQIVQAQKDQSSAGKFRAASLDAQLQGAQLTLAAAQANLAGNQRLLDMYRQLVRNPLELTAALHAAEKQVQVAQAGLKAARVELDWVRRSPQPEAVALAEAKLNTAQANLKLVQLQASRYRVASPLDGVVVDRSIDPGETSRPGSTLLIIANTDELQMTVYVPIRYMSSLHVGQAAALKVPSIPSKTFSAKVTYISSDAEFKPANLYNSQDRSEIVYAVRVTASNTTRELKAGLPADATFR